MSNTSRHYTRAILLQALYQFQYNPTDYHKLRDDFQENTDDKIDMAYFEEVLQGILGNLEDIDKTFSPHISRSMESIDPIAKALCRLGTYELRYQLSIPYKVIINEALELAKSFGAESSFRFINSILDKVAKDVRPEYN